MGMTGHRVVDLRNRAYAAAVVAHIDADPAREGLTQARETCARWLLREGAEPDLHEWQRILLEPWERIRALLLAEGERATRLRQSSPFVGIITDEERSAILREYPVHAKA